MSDNSYYETLAQHSDSKLKEIVESKHNDYQPDAVKAAVEILRKRKVKFTEPPPDEHVEMTYDEIKADIKARLAKGEQMPEIRAYYRSCGVDIDSPEIKEYSADVVHVSNYYTLRLVGMLLGVGGALFMALNKSTGGDATRWAFYIVAGVAVIWFLLSFRKK